MSNPLFEPQALLSFLWTWTMSVQFLLVIMTTMIYFRSKQKVFAAYAAYVFLVSLYMLTRIPFTDVPVLSDYYHTPMLGRLAQVLAFIVYYHFLLLFLDVKSELPAFYNKAVRIINSWLVLGLLAFVYCVVSYNPQGYTVYYFYIHAPLALLILVYIYWGTWSLRGPLRAFFVYGNLVYYLAVLLTTIFSVVRVESDLFLLQAPVAILYIGLLSELFVFSWGLAYKIEGEYRARLEAQESLGKLQNNQRIELQEKLNAKEDELKSMFEEQQKERELSLKKDFEDKLTRMEVDILRAQMNPHMLFNSLNTLKHFILTEDKINAVEYLGRLSSFMRKILRLSSVREISLYQEIQFLELYVEMENMRFDQDVVFSFQNDSNHNPEDIKIPPMILQPIIENAFHHGLMRKVGDKNIDILVRDAKLEGLDILVRDNGVGRQKDRNRSPKPGARQSKGLKMVAQRMELNFGSAPSFISYVQIRDLGTSSEDTGTEVAFWVPAPHNRILTPGEVNA